MILFDADNLTSRSKTLINHALDLEQGRRNPRRTTPTADIFELAGDPTSSIAGDSDEFRHEPVLALNTPPASQC